MPDIEDLQQQTQQQGGPSFGLSPFMVQALNYRFDPNYAQQMEDQRRREEEAAAFEQMQGAAKKIFHYDEQSMPTLGNKGGDYQNSIMAMINSGNPALVKLGLDMMKEGRTTGISEYEYGKNDPRYIQQKIDLAHASNPGFGGSVKASDLSQYRMLLPNGVLGNLPAGTTPEMLSAGLKDGSIVLAGDKGDEASASLKDFNESMLTYKKRLSELNAQNEQLNAHVPEKLRFLTGRANELSAGKLKNTAASDLIEARNNAILNYARVKGINTAGMTKPQIIQMLGGEFTDGSEGIESQQEKLGNLDRFIQDSASKIPGFKLETSAKMGETQGTPLTAEQVDKTALSQAQSMMKQGVRSVVIGDIKFVNQNGRIRAFKAE